MLPLIYLIIINAIINNTISTYLNLNNRAESICSWHQ